MTFPKSDTYILCRFERGLPETVMKELTAKTELYHIINHMDSSLDLVDLYIESLTTSHKELQTIINGVGKETVMDWLLNGFSFSHIASPVEISVQGVATIINKASCYQRLHAEGRSIPSDYLSFAKDLLDHLPTKSAVKKHYDVYRPFVEALINVNPVNRLYLEDVLEGSNKSSRYIEMYGKVLHSLSL